MLHTPSIELEPSEKLLVTVFANLFRGWEAVGGKLYITNRRIRFESHRWNGQPGPSEILLRKVTSVGPFDNLGLIPNGMVVESEEGEAYRFVVWERRRLIELIQLMMTKPQDIAKPKSAGGEPLPPSPGVWDRELDGLP